MQMVRSQFGEAAMHAVTLAVHNLLDDEDEFEDDDVLEGELLSEET